MDGDLVFTALLMKNTFVRGSFYRICMMKFGEDSTN